MIRRTLAGMAAGLLLTGSLAGGAAHAATTQVTTDTTTVTLNAEHGSKASGTAVFYYNSRTNITTVSLRVHGLKPLSVHPAHIHLGTSCTANGPVEYSFHPLSSATSMRTTAGKDGVMRASLSFHGSFVGRHFYVNVHKGPGLSTASQFTPIACGVLR